MAIGVINPFEKIDIHVLLSMRNVDEGFRDDVTCTLTPPFISAQSPAIRHPPPRR